MPFFSRCDDLAGPPAHKRYGILFGSEGKLEGDGGAELDDVVMIQAAVVAARHNGLPGRTPQDGRAEGTAFIFDLEALAFLVEADTGMRPGDFRIFGGTFLKSDLIVPDRIVGSVNRLHSSNVDDPVGRLNAKFGIPTDADALQHVERGRKVAFFDLGGLMQLDQITFE